MNMYVGTGCASMQYPNFCEPANCVTNICVRVGAKYYNVSASA